MLTAIKKLITKNNKYFIAILLLASILPVFILQNNKNGFEETHHGFISAHGLALGNNFSFKNSGLLYNRKFVDQNNKISYQAYNRFPLFPILLLKPVLQLTHSSLTWQIYAGRQLMNIFFCLAIIIIFIALWKYSSNAYLSLATTIIAFSSYSLLHYADMIFFDTPALLGLSLAFLVFVYSQKNDFKKIFWLLIPASVALGWPALGVYLLWLMAAFIKWLIVRHKESPDRNFLTVKSQYSRAIKIFALGFLTALAFLAYQLLTEWHITRLPFSEMRTMINFREAFSENGYGNGLPNLKFFSFLSIQLKYIDSMIKPYIIRNINYLNLYLLLLIMLAVYGIWRKVKRKDSDVIMFIIVIAGSGFLWQIIMKNFTAFHDFQAIYYLGVALILFFYLFSLIPKKWHLGIAIFAVIIFIYSIAIANKTKALDAPLVNQYTLEFQIINDKLPFNSRIYINNTDPKPGRVLGLVQHAVDFYLAGGILVDKPQDAEYIISTLCPAQTIPLTANPHFNLCC